MVITSSVPSAFSFSRVTSADNWPFWGSYIVFWSISSSISSLLVTNSASRSTSVSIGTISYVLTAPSKAVSGCIEVRISRLTSHAGRPCLFRMCAAYARSFWNTFMSFWNTSFWDKFFFLPFHQLFCDAPPHVPKWREVTYPLVHSDHRCSRFSQNQSCEQPLDVFWGFAGHSVFYGRVYRVWFL